MSWLQSRLTPAKAENPRWKGFAKALEGIWDDNFIPYLSRYQRLRSSFEADDADLAKQIAQMGDYFSYEFPKPQDRAISLAWRRLELEYKDLELILSMALRRHFGSLEIQWLPLYAPVDKTYGEDLVPFEQVRPDSQKYIPPDGHFLTSRGVIGVSLNSIYSQGYTKQDVYSEAFPLVKRIKPIHIVFDGFFYYIRFDLPFTCDVDVWWESESASSFAIPFNVYGHYFDTTPADVWFLDTQGFSCTWEEEEKLPIDFYPASKLWHLDWHLPFNPPEDWIPLDVVLAGYEGEEVKPARLAYADKKQFWTVPAASPEMQTGTADKDWTPSVVFADKNAASFQAESQHTQAIPAFEDRYDWLDHYLRYDDFSADVFPLDMPIEGKKYA